MKLSAAVQPIDSTDAITTRHVFTPAHPAHPAHSHWRVNRSHVRKSAIIPPSDRELRLTGTEPPTWYLRSILAMVTSQMPPKICCVTFYLD
jgi:hypothetical protein